MDFSSNIVKLQKVFEKASDDMCAFSFIRMCISLSSSICYINIELVLMGMFSHGREEKRNIEEKSLNHNQKLIRERHNHNHQYYFLIQSENAFSSSLRFGKT